MRPRKLNVGDRITFKAATRCSYRKATRVVTGFWITGEPEVSYAGWRGFVVHWHEILEVRKA